ncbi:hypothetical protein WMF38_26080 [Sorangium sp. So ce118]
MTPAGDGVGVFCFPISDRKKCEACNENMEAYFPLEAEQVVMRAVNEFNAALLAGVPPAPKAQLKPVVEFTWRPRCDAVRMISASKRQDYQPHYLLPERPV